MFDSTRRAIENATYAYGASPRWNHRERATIHPGDLREPWKSVYGFPMTAARLAAGQELVLHCREDEVFDRLAQFNSLLESPESLSRAYTLLEKRVEATEQKLARLLRLRDESLSESELPDLMAEVEAILADSGEPTVTDRLADLLTPNDPTHEITGVGKMLARLREGLQALGKVKEQGFRVVVLDRCRQPQRPNLAAHGQVSIPQAGQPGRKAVTLYPPVQYHLTLWRYVIAKSSSGQSAVWN